MIFFLSLQYIVYVTQLIMGDRTYALHPEDWVVANIILYIYIIQLFLELLQILGAANDLNR